MKTKNYSSAPLPFQGQKRRFVKQFIEVIKKQPANIYVDLFGGSGLLSHVTKATHPEARVIFNDYDNFSERLANIPKTNALLSDLREMNKGINPDAKLSDVQRGRVLERLKQEAGYVDYITLSSSLLFAMQYAKSLEELSKATFYNKVKMSDYNADGYLLGVDIVKDDYRNVYSAFKDHPGVV